MYRLEMHQPVDNGQYSTLNQAETSFRRVSKYRRGQIFVLTLTFLVSTAACLTLSYVNFVLAPDCILFAYWVIDKAESKSGSPITTQSTLKQGQLESNFSLNVDDFTNHPYLTRIAGLVSPEDPDHSDLESTVNMENNSGDYIEDPSVVYLSPVETRWGKKRHCYVAQYGFASAAAASFILCWFFVFFRPTRHAYVRKKKTAASKLVVPAILLSSAFVLCTLVAAVTVQMGFAAWCRSVDKILARCSSIRDYAVHWSNNKEDMDIFSILVAAQILSWLGTLTWLINLILLANRLYHHVDFPSYFFNTPVTNRETATRSEIDIDRNDGLIKDNSVM